ncbi:MAG: DUF1302 family protein [Pseudomonadota bacterium]
MWRRMLAVAVLTASACASGEEVDPFDFDLLSESVGTESPWEISGYVEFRNQYLTEQEDWLSNRFFGLMDVRWSRGRWRALAIASAEYDPATTDFRDPERSELREGYLHYDGDSWDLTVGRIRVAWGTADGVSTIDRVNAIDLREPIANARTASRRPSWLIRLEKSTAIGIFEAVWLPRGRDRKLPEFGSPWEPQSLNELRSLEAAGLIDLTIDDPHRPEGGLRYQHFGRGLDWGLAVYNGYTDVPASLDVEGSSVRLFPERITTFNVNGAFGLKSSTLRAEIAYTPDFPEQGETSDLWQAVIGWDRTVLTNLYLNFQAFWNSTEVTPDQYGMTFAVTHPVLDDAATVGFRGQAARNDEFSAELFADFQWTDRINLLLRYFVFEGEPGTLLGDFAENDFVECTLRFSF